jgi:hypothetical protein
MMIDKPVISSTMKSNLKYFPALLVLFVRAFSVSADTPDQVYSEDSAAVKVGKPLYGFFNSDELLEITIQFNMREFIRTRTDNEKKFSARLTVHNANNSVLSQDIKLNARGKMRRKYCSFPPIMLKVRNPKGQKQVFEKGNYKLVTHCSISGNFQNYILKEYLAYKLYNLVTPYSFKTRLVMVNYVDSINPKRIFREYGILIEDIDDLAARNKAIIIENPKISQGHMDNYEMAKVAFFNYMIGNTDWSVAEQHNIKVLKIDNPSAQKGIPVTYDFDYSGFVNTSYSSPTTSIPINHVTERYYLGGCYSDELLLNIFSEFDTLRPQIENTIRDFPYLQKAQKNLALSYINGFYKKYKRQNSLLADLNRTCLRLD